ncbi:uncharacterized protein ACLA_004520 [Aspergillus clavatus NRRL 1]|uniref:Uncharacterized protein n=1 Tax=Aspergillus clavatus (strain ATCC 1007 / CBS 513.65 / DSM 816 / NCTC 3887 / NRRL 1 / QM 1276 / 107) TaxID=344612 RepID=A1C5S0_ASPCL|nr:uncharacterized protein ACLA_004520 [Aspergillus clavatus NRRL 1]EAW15038.1 hypothetical protein ACLA_004520 [Aspergillus clavatus NRRL 1]
MIMHNWSSYSHVKWLMSSRNWPSIKERLDTAEQLSLELNTESVSTAVQQYIDHQVHQLVKQKKYNSKPQNAVQQHLCENAKGTFLWVALVCQYLERVRWEPLAKMKTFAPGLDSLYQRMMQEIRESEEDGLCREILGFMAAAYRPIALQELASFCNILAEYSNDDEALRSYKPLWLLDNSRKDESAHGIKLLEVEGVKRSRSIDKRTFGIGNGKGNDPLPPILKPLSLPLSELLGATLALCDVAVTPACISAVYNITRGTKATKGNELGIFEDLGDVQIPQGTHPILKAVNGAQAPTSVSNAGPESNLDFQISYPVIWPQNSILFQIDDPVYQAHYNFTGFLNTFLDAIDGFYCNEISPLDPPYPDAAAGGYKGQLHELLDEFMLVVFSYENGQFQSASILSAFSSVNVLLLLGHWVVSRMINPPQRI